MDLAVDARSCVALLCQLVEEAFVLALATTDDGREHLEASAVLELEDAVDDLLRRLPGDLFAAVRTVRHPDAREQQT